MADNTEIPPEGGPRSLAHSINSAIASSHTRINRLILDRMPRAVPPQADNPSAYITGLLHIGAVYIAFESLWQNIIGLHTEIAPLPYTYPFHNGSVTGKFGPQHGPMPPQVTQRARDILESAYWPNMLRSARVKADIRTMTGWPAHVVDEQLRSAGTTGALGAFLAHIQDAVDDKPHLLLSYSYSLYLALLSGGSYIRTELMYLRADFWLAVPDPIRPGLVPCIRELSSELGNAGRHRTFEYDSGSHQVTGEDPSITLPLSFLDFDTPLGHENPRQQAKDLKAEFKRRFTHSELALTEPERRDIVDESVAIFDHLESVVGQLDKICGSGTGVTRQGKPRRDSSKADSQPVGFGSRLRDSIAVAKGRLLRTMKRSSGVASSVTATTPLAVKKAATAAKNTTASPPELPESSRMSSDSPGGPFKGLQGDEPDAHLARDAVVPGEAFRTVRYSDDNNQMDTAAPATMSEGRSYDGAADYEPGRCPISRSPSPPAKKSVAQSTRVASMGRGPRHALHAAVSKVAVLFGIAMAFALYVYVRRYGDAITPISGRLTATGW